MTHPKGPAGRHCVGPGRSPGTPMSVARVCVYGVSIQDVYARSLIGGLTKTGTAPAKAAATKISAALARHDSAGPLTPDMRDAILATLDVPTHKGTKDLYRALLKDQAARRDD